MKDQQPQRIGVVITTYNSPEWLMKVLIGYECQTDKQFTVLIADDGSGAETKELIEKFKLRNSLQIEHYWQEDEGFQKTRILNKVISGTSSDYLIFTDGDCIPRSDFIAVHRAEAQRGYFLSGGYIKLSMSVSTLIDESMITSQKIFDRSELIRLGQPASHKLWKLTKSDCKRRLLNFVTPTKATWNGMNSSGWISDLLAVNGFDERMQYGGLDRELGERLVNYGVGSKQIRYSAICLHLDHQRGYANPVAIEKNRMIRDEVKTKNLAWSEFGIKQQMNNTNANE